jgi:hypothetical protein
MTGAAARRVTRFLSAAWIPALAAVYCVQAIMATDNPTMVVRDRELSLRAAIGPCLFILSYASVLFAILRPDRWPLSSRRVAVASIVALFGLMGHVLMFVTDGPPEVYVPGRFVFAAAVVLVGHLVAVVVRRLVRSFRATPV